MARKPKHINFEFEIEQQVVQLRECVGKPVPLSCRYVRGDRPILVRIEEDTAELSAAKHSKRNLSMGNFVTERRDLYTAEPRLRQLQLIHCHN